MPPSKKRGIFGFGSDGGVAPMSGSQKPPKRQKISKAAQTMQDLLSEADEITKRFAKENGIDLDSEYEPEEPIEMTESEQEEYEATTFSEGEEDGGDSSWEDEADEATLAKIEDPVLSRKEERERNARIEKRAKKNLKRMKDRCDRIEYDAGHDLFIKDEEIDPRTIAKIKEGGYCILEPDPNGDVKERSEETYFDHATKRTIKLTSQQPCRGKRVDPKNPEKEIDCPASLSRSEIRCKVCGYHRLNESEDINLSTAPKRGFIMGRRRRKASVASSRCEANDS